MNPPKEMQIARNTIFGPPSVVAVQRVATPRPKKNEILIQTHAASVSSGDARLRARRSPRGFGLIMGLLFGFRTPRYFCLGTDAAGTIIELGPKVSRFQLGDRVCVNLGMKLRGHAQYVTVPESSAVTKIPDAVSFDSAAALVFGGSTALTFLKHLIQLKSGESLLVLGAGGAVGSAAVQLAHHLGANISAVCSSEKATRVQNLGAHQMIDYQKPDWKRSLGPFDVVLDTVGQLSLKEIKSLLKPEGRAGLVIADLPTMLKSALANRFSSKKILVGSARESRKDLDDLLELCAQNQFSPLIGRTFPLTQIVEAHRLADSGHKLGTLLVYPQD